MLENKLAARKKLLLIGRAAAVLLPVMLVALLLTQVAFAKTTYVINDGGNIVLHSTFTTDPAEILDEVGVELGENDTYTSQDGVGISSIHIQRMHEVTVVCGEQTYQVTSCGGTVAQLLHSQQILWDDDDILSVDPDTETYDGLTIVLTKIEKVELSYTQPIEHGTVYLKDSGLPRGNSIVQVQGQDGKAHYTELVTYVNGVETERIQQSYTVISAPVDQVEVVGTGLLASDIPEGQLYIKDGIIITPDGEMLSYSSTLQVVATAYHNTDPGCTIYTAIGTLCRVGAIAVDPKVIPYGTRMYIITNDGKYIYGVAVAEDCGSAIKGNRVDLYFDTTDECWTFGIREATVFFLD